MFNERKYHSDVHRTERNTLAIIIIIIILIKE